MRWFDLGFILPFFLALLPVAAVASITAGLPPDLGAWLPLVVIFVVLPLLDVICGADASNHADTDAERIDRLLYFRVLTLLTLPAWLLVLIYSAQALQQIPFGMIGVLGWLLSTGILGGILAINPAHELIHKSGLLERTVGGMLLTSVSYHGFKIEHVRGHHVHVATAADSSSARLGESVYAFVPRALFHNMRNAWRLEVQRLHQARKSVWSLRNEMLAWTVVWLVVLAAFSFWLGALGAAFFIAQGLLAATSLEVINYIEHYGLMRAQIAPGRYERVTHLHSWNSSQRLSNWLLFNLQRHSDHHAVARRRYQVLVHHDDSPQLPAGYASMFVLALLPPLWRRVMDPRVQRSRQRQRVSPAV